MFPLVKLYSLLRGTRFLTWFDVPKSLFIYIFILFIIIIIVIVPMFPLVTQSEKGRGFYTCVVTRSQTKFSKSTPHPLCEKSGNREHSLLIKYLSGNNYGNKVKRSGNIINVVKRGRAWLGRGLLSGRSWT